MFNKALRMARNQAKVTRSRLPAFLGFYGQTKFEMTWNIVKNGTAEPELKHIKNISKGHRFMDDAKEQFESITKCKTARCGFFHFANDKRHGSSSDELRQLGILTEVKTRTDCSLSPLNL